MSGGGSVGGAVVFGWGVEFFPVDAGAVSHRDSGRPPCTQRAVFPSFPVERLDLSVRDGVGREPRVGFRMHGVLVASPAHRLDLSHQGQAPVPAQHVADVWPVVMKGLVYKKMMWR